MVKRENKNKKVIVAMSGGVDSSVAAALLKRAGFNIVGVFMKFWKPRINADSNADLRGFENRCCSLEAEKRARQVAQVLGIPFYVLNFEKEFKQRIVDYFLAEYKKGRTPNPCVVCNKQIKFGLLLEKVLGLKGDFVATGHYVKVQKEFVNSQKIRYSLIRAKDKEKDQSYFLWQLNQEQLRHILFPVGDYTKTQVRNFAKKFKLPVFNIPESQEVCFVPKTLNDFLKKYLKEKPGPIVEESPDGVRKTIGKHRGLWFYTIGQRKGIELSGGPYYVIGKDIKKNTLIVSSVFEDERLYQKTLVAEKVNWLSARPPKLPAKVKAQIRYRHQAVPATITKKLKGNKIELKFTTPQRAITPGQSAVFYKGQELLGGGIID